MLMNVFSFSFSPLQKEFIYQEKIDYESSLHECSQGPLRGRKNYKSSLHERRVCQSFNSREFTNNKFLPKL